MTAYTSINLPFSALSTEISEKTFIRTRLNASRFTGSIIAGLTGLIIAGFVLGSEGSNNNEIGLKLKFGHQVQCSLSQLFYVHSQLKDRWFLCLIQSLSFTYSF